MNEWMENFYSNQQDDCDRDLINDARHYDEIIAGRENVRCSMCGSYVFRKDTKRIEGYNFCKICIKEYKVK